MKTEIINDLNDQINKYADGIISLHLNKEQAEIIVKALQQNEWIKVNKNELPRKEVLAISKTNHYLLGYLSVDNEGYVDCDDEYQQLLNVTHYMLLTPPEKIKL